MDATITSALIATGGMVLSAGLGTVAGHISSRRREAASVALTEAQAEDLETQVAERVMRMQEYERSQLNRRIEELEDQIEQLKSRLAQREQELQRDLESLRGERETLRVEAADLRMQLAAKEAELAAAKREVDRLTSLTVHAQSQFGGGGATSSGLDR